MIRCQKVKVILSFSISFFWCINNSYLENRRNKAKLKLYLVSKKKKQGSLKLVKVRGYLVIFTGWTMFLLLSVYRRNYSVALFLSGSIIAIVTLID